VTTAAHSTPSDLPAITLVERSDEVMPALSRLDLEVVGVDVERADADRYHRHAALVQVGGPGLCVLLDGMVLDDMAALDTYLGSRLTVLHAASNDVVPLAAKGVRPARLVDTAVAAAVLGLPIGLGALLEGVLDLRLEGDKEAFQRADWARRPIPPPMQAYAAGDVVHLPALWQELAERLTATGRTTWFEQELDAALTNAVTDNRDWRRVRGVGRLNPHQQLIARALWELREELAREHDIAPNLLLHDEVILAFSLEPPRTSAQLVRRARRRRRLEEEHAARFLRAVEDALASQPDPPDPDRRRWTEADDRAFDRMREARAAVAKELGIDSGVLCSSRPLKEAVREDPRDADELEHAAGLRAWQAELLRDVLWEAYRGRGRRRRTAAAGTGAEDAADTGQEADADGSAAAVPADAPTG
jgi:ribonuclease D